MGRSGVSLSPLEVHGHKGHLGGDSDLLTPPLYFCFVLTCFSCLQTGSLQVHIYRGWFGGEIHWLPPLPYFSLSININICSTSRKPINVHIGKLLWSGSPTLWSVHSRSFPLLESTQWQETWSRAQLFKWRMIFRQYKNHLKEDVKMFCAITSMSHLHLDTVVDVSKSLVPGSWHFLCFWDKLIFMTPDQSRLGIWVLLAVIGYWLSERRMIGYGSG